MAPRPDIFKWRQTERTLILCAVRRYLRCSLSLRDVEELLEERGLAADHITVWRCVQRYGPKLEQRMRPHLESTSAWDSIRGRLFSEAILMQKSRVTWPCFYRKLHLS
jgi:transposase-like protein